MDFVEADLHLEGGGLGIRHGRRLGPFPLVYDRWHIKPHLRPPTLEEILAGGPRGLFLDLKMAWGWPLATPPGGLGPILERLRGAGFLRRTVLSSQDWALLDGARGLEPGLRLSYSVGYGWHLKALGRRLEGAAPPAHQGESPTMVAIRHSFLDPELTLALRRRGVTVVAWIVDSPHRARQLLGWGVGGIVSNNLALLGNLLGEPA